ncbi:MAG: hypothetical protein K6B38_04095 [Ruminococcus sp.]|nr:hypothetical protein [Ruminococcus sp.]
MNSFKHLAALTAAFLMGTSLVSCGSRSVFTNIADTPIITVTITETEPVTIATEETEATSAETVTDTETVKYLNKETAPTVEETSEAVEVTSDEGYPVVDDSYVAYHFRSKKQLNEHFEKHGAEFDGDFDYQSAEDYEEGASDVINNDDALFKYEKEDGDGVYYIEATNEFVILSKDGYIRTYFRPTKGKKYFDKQ